ncbi:2-aminoethylphosphonate ABC transporter permease subunit [Williamsia phyllosphaerae]|uniref:2-aminoethylphosphonate ABC transporter permease n=1 Tax=Williamsia phyllosphaerae TaxID=885042 RepID=A0ABQ1UVA2_9NOCA|nr:2-aminoethylphosphonate ABC transporter permease subunit [Williamsia phyllosphaerae]GGF25979.1 2-aminoethylphosphonate ABC transporter permease [Williamsia phyllosphaerae]
MTAGLVERLSEAPTPEPNPPVRRTAAVWWTIGPLVIVAVVAVYPLVRVLLNSTSGRGTSSWSGVLSSELFRTSLVTTARIAACATLGCLVLGTFIAVVLAFVPFPGSTVVGRLIDTVLALPSFLITLAFTFIYGSAGIVNAALFEIIGSRPVNFLTTELGVIVAEITFFTPFVVRPLLAAFAMVPREQLDVAASLGASPWRVLRTVVMPEAWPALIAGGGLVLLLTLNEFGIVLFTGAKDVTTLPVLIYTRGIVTFDLPGAAVIATVQVGLSIGLYLLYRKAFAQMTSGRGASTRKDNGNAVLDQA